MRQNGREVLIADTVGFIRKLPHQLVEAFKATFEEVERSDLLLHVIDSSEPECIHQMDVVDGVLSELELSEKPCIKVYNKCDAEDVFVRDRSDGISISALKEEGLGGLVERIDLSFLRTSNMRILNCLIPEVEFFPRYTG